ncbi:MAG: hypothetical protein LBL59_07675 [Xanthomonadaceae bacterium]|jgi:hypothetical protein|nr:hypothetical protein [Xanthomonadaceae bacterium]
MSGIKRGGIMFLLIVIGLLAFAAMSWMVFTWHGAKMDRRYDTLADARAGGLFQQGWLPDALPPSARSIRTSNNLDLNLSFGGFEMAVADADAFFARLDAPAPAEAPFERWPGVLKDYAERGYSVHYYRQDGNMWAFFCIAQAGHCDYLMWSTRSDLERLRERGSAEEGRI